MNARRACEGDERTCPKGGQPPIQELTAAEQGTSRPPRLRFLRAHAVALALVGLLAFVFLPPALVAPSGGLELVATLIVTLLACALVCAICYESLRR